MSIFDDQCTEGDRSNLISEISFNEDSVLEDVLAILEDTSEDEVNADYPNEAYGDLMALVTKYKLNNTTGNAIIKFFNKHANFVTSPLPKSIKQGHDYMDNMNLPTLTFTKTCVINYNNNEYYFHHRPLINCIKNILSISDISQNFALNFEMLKVIMSIIQLCDLCNFYKILTLYTYSTMEKGYIVSKIPDYGGKIQKILTNWRQTFIFNFIFRRYKC